MKTCLKNKCLGFPLYFLLLNSSVCQVALRLLPLTILGVIVYNHIFYWHLHWVMQKHHISHHQAVGRLFQMLLSRLWCRPASHGLYISFMSAFKLLFDKEVKMSALITRVYMYVSVFLWDPDFEQQSWIWEPTV